eukprot:7075180-Prymnesium_polylepis.1
MLGRADELVGCLLYGHPLRIMGGGREVGGEVATHSLTANSKHERVKSSPRLELYVQVDGKSRVKTHVWVEALADMFANSMKALADVDDTE